MNNIVDNYDVAIAMEKVKIRVFRKYIGKLSKFLLCYELINILVILLCYMIMPLDSSSDSGFLSILGTICGMIFIILYKKKQLFTYDLKRSNKKMDKSTFLKIFLCFMSIQFVWTIISISTESLLNIFGYSLAKEIQSACSPSTTIPMFIYASFLGPIFEEIIFRGVVLHSLERYGKLFAIILSSLLFGFFHGNLLQGVFATMSGFILAYVTLEYSIKWSILLHILNNFIFGDLFNMLIKDMNPLVSGILIWSIFLLFFIGAIKVVWKNRFLIRNYIKNNNTEKGFYRYAFSSTWMLIYIGIHLLLGISGIDKIV